jgi:pyrroline-5-carboxylate reductase
MGIAIISGVLASLESSAAQGPQSIFQANATSNKWESHTPGTSTPKLRTPDTSSPGSPVNGAGRTALSQFLPPIPDKTIPTRFLACVHRQATAQKLKQVFEAIGPIGSCVEIYQNANIEAVKQSNVVLLW